MARYVARLDDGMGHEEALVIGAPSAASAAERAVMTWLKQKRFAVTDLPMDVLVQPASIGPFYRFRVREQSKFWVLSELRACGQCGCCEDRACPQGCSWAGKHLCSACAEGAEE